MRQLAANVTKMFNHTSMGYFTDIIQIRGHDECVDSNFIRYVYKSPTACISTSVDTYEKIKRVMDSGTFFLFPTTLSANGFIQSIPYWKVLDLFWGYNSYSTDHNDPELDTSTHMYKDHDVFMSTDTGHDEELKKLVYDDDVDLQKVADMAMMKLYELSSSDMARLHDVQSSIETVFMININNPPSKSYTFDSFFGDIDVYKKAIKRLGVDL